MTDQETVVRDLLFAFGTLLGLAHKDENPKWIRAAEQGVRLLHQGRIASALFAVEVIPPGVREHADVPWTIYDLPGCIGPPNVT